MPFRRFAPLAAAVWLLCAAPLFLARVLPFADYPGHLARYAILARPDDPFVAAFWRPAWAPLPNLGVDLLAVALARALPVILAGQVAVALLVGLWGFGFAFLHRQWRGAWHPWGLVGFPLVYSFPLQMGFLNYVLGVGLMMTGLGLHLRVRRAATTTYVAAMAPFALVTAVSHLFAFGQLLLAIVVLEFIFRRTAEREPSPVLRVLGRSSALVVLPLVYVKLGPAGSGAGSVTLSSMVSKARMTALVLSQGSPLLDIVVLGCSVGAVVFCARQGWRPARAAIALALTLVAVFFATPDGAFATHHLDSRQPIVVILLFLALSSGSPSRVAGGLLAGVLALHVAGNAWAIRTRGAGLDRISAALARVPDGSLLAFAQGDRDGNWAFRNWNPPLMQAGALGLLDHRLYPTMIFAIRNQQPLALRPEAAPASLVPEYPEPDFPTRGIADLRAGRARGGGGGGRRPMAVLFAAGPGGAKPGPGARLLASEGRWGLYLIEDNGR